jgi:crotonobetainyl-CoA:carnitine CoA-transferase CaiB-like acyl-CoA transferase
VPLHGDDKLKETISSPITVRGLPKTRATRAPELGEHNDQVLAELGFSPQDIDGLRAEKTIPGATERKAAA